MRSSAHAGSRRKAFLPCCASCALHCTRSSLESSHHCDRGKLVGETVVQPELDAHMNGEGVPLFVSSSIHTA